jgi:hypothetical protein
MANSRKAIQGSHHEVTDSEVFIKQMAEPSERSSMGVRGANTIESARPNNRFKRMGPKAGPPLNLDVGRN